MTSREWREPIDCWLADVGAASFATVPFRHAVIGFEASGLALDEVTKPDRYYGVLVGGIGGVDAALRCCGSRVSASCVRALGSG
jgi:hypothetical protein